MKNKRTILFAMSSLFACSVNAEVSTYPALGLCPDTPSQECRVFFDPNGVRLKQGIMTVSLIQDYSRPQSIKLDGKKKTYKSADVYMTFDCAKRRYQKVETIYRADNYCRGKIVGSHRAAGTGEGAWKPFPTDASDTIGALLKKTAPACQR
ncbi:surface-adhesin E family protein [uncultured Thiodictyon sp.]|uniref:surface-adhesin E family protein n=1 Tax=uncultured Thiodictyon sp. TaxID=1846217 RepID=UPI0025E4C9FF|nr:surface-adhesin E family protein [uncultured Thiodictyon sp.]